MAKIRDGSTYLSQHLTANDYYSENESVRGHWIGGGAERLGLRGEIHGHDAAFEALRTNRHPLTGEKLTPRDCADRIRFFDFQCSAQKSVSVMAVTLGDERLLAAHDRAAAIAFSELEKFAATQANTVFMRDNRITGNVTAAAFRHTASRALDPQMHTHFVTANATWDQVANSWRALTEFEMVRAIRYGGKVYQNELARACIALGYAVEHVRDIRGTVTGFELAGVSAIVRERFSKRRAEVEAGIAEFKTKHVRGPTIAEIHAITVKSRSAKLHESTTPEVLANQRRQLSSAEWSDLLALKVQAEGRAVNETTRDAPPCERESLRFAVGHLFERRSVARGHELLAEALNQNLGKIDFARLRRVAGESRRVVALTPEPWLRADFATPHGLALEHWATKFIDRSRNQFPELGRAAADPRAILSVEQRRALTEVLATRDQVVCLRGAAGVGKTTVVKELHRALAVDGRHVFYCAPTSSAADTLRKDGLSTATTLTDFLQNGAERQRDGLAGGVFVVDEAGLASNRQGADLLRLAERHHARVVFIGDTRQHTSVEAGDFLRILERHTPLHRVELSEIRRQVAQEYREAVGLMAAGSSRAGLERLDQMKWVHEGGAEYLRAAAVEYLHRSDGGLKLDAVLAVTPTWDENRAFTVVLRDELKTRGILKSGEEFTVHDPMRWTKAQKQRADNYAPGMIITFNRAAGRFGRGESVPVLRVMGGRVLVAGRGDGERVLPLRRGNFEVFQVRALDLCVGDRLLIRANYRAGGFINGEIVTATEVSGGKIRMSDGRAIEVAKFRQFSHGFAVTSHKSQSKSVDHVVVAAERLDAKAAYVACSRGRSTCSLHTPDKAALLDKLPTGTRTAAMDLSGMPGVGCSKTTCRADAWGRVAQVGQNLRGLDYAKLGRALDMPWWRGAALALADWCLRALPGSHGRRAVEKCKVALEL